MTNLWLEGGENTIVNKNGNGRRNKLLCRLSKHNMVIVTVCVDFSSCIHVSYF